MRGASAAASTNGTRIRIGRSGNSRTHRHTWFGVFKLMDCGAVVVDMTSLSGQPNARVDVSVEDVDHQVHEYDHDPGEHDHSLHEWEIALEDALVQQSANAGPREHHLDDDGGIDHHNQIDARQCQHRHQRILEAVLGNDDVTGKPLEPGQLDIFAAHNLEHARSREAQQ